MSDSSAPAAEPGYASEMACGRLARERNDAAAAVAHYRNALAWRHGDHWARLGLAQAQGDGGQLDEAERELRALLRERQGFHQARLALARCLKAQDRIDAALAVLAEAHRRHPNEYAVALAYARMLRECSGAARALPLLRQIAEQWPTVHAARLAYGDALADTWQFEDAEREYHAAHDAEPQVHRALLGIARCRREREGILSALPWYERAHDAARPADRALRQQHAKAHFDAGRVEQARALYAQMQAEDGDWHAAGIGLARCLWWQGETARAQAELDRVCATVTGLSPAALEAATLYRDWGVPESARRLAWRVHDEDPRRSVDALLHLAATENAMHRHGDALDHLEKAVRRWPRSEELRLALAATQVVCGDVAAAEAQLLSLATDESPGVAVHVRLAEIAIAGKRFDAAFEYVKRALSTRVQPPAAALALAQIFAETGRTDAAVRLLKLLSTRRKGAPEYARRACILLRRVGRIAETDEWIARSLPHNPGHWGLHIERFWTDHARGALDAAAQTLLHLHPMSVAQQAELHFLTGTLAQARWQIDAALHGFDTCLALNARHRHAHQAAIAVQLLRGDIVAARAHLQALARLDEPRRRQEGLPVNASQSHMGQWLDEYDLDRELLAQMTACRQLSPPEHGLDAWIDLVRRAPDHTPAAVGLMVALRTGGLITAVPGGWQPGAAIPAKIAQYWDDDEPPTDVRDYMLSWQRLNPPCEYRLFSDRTAGELLAARFSAPVLAAFRTIREPAMRADFFRLAWLLAEGGFYVDADDRCRRSFVEWIPAGATFLAWQEIYGTVGNNILGACAGHPIIATALDMATRAILRGDEDLLWLATGPGLLTRAVATTLAVAADWRAATAGLAILTQAQLATGVSMHGFAAYKNTGRHWMRAAASTKRTGSAETARGASGIQQPREAL